jgi:hypothetical protein
MEGSMSERRIGFIPNGTTIRRGQETCGVMVTDQRTIVVFEEPWTQLGIREEFRRSFGGDSSKPSAPRKTIDFATVDLDELAKTEGNQSVPHASIEKLAVGKGIGGYGIWMSYLGENQKKDYLIVDLVPPAALIKKRKSEGVGASETKKQYAMKCQEVYRKALPPIIAEKVEWKI